MKFALRFTALALVALATLVACGGGTRPEDEGKTVFRYNEPGGVTSLDPANAYNAENIWLVNQLFNGLVELDANLLVQPGIASGWSISDDGTIYTFTLREDVYFHDSECFEGGKGRLVTAQDFVYSFHRILDEETASQGRSFFNVLDNSERGQFTGIVAENATTLKLYLKHPFPPFLGILAMKFFSVVPKEAVEYYRLDFRRNPVGTGPFMFKTWKEGEKLVLVRNPNYFEQDADGQALPYLDGVAVSFMKDRQVSFLNFQKGQLDFLSGLDPTFKDKVLTHEGEVQSEFDGKFEVTKAPYLKTDYIGFLVDMELDAAKSSPTADRNIRQAINYGFDRAKMVRYLRNNLGYPATSGFMPRGLPAFDEEAVPGYTYDPDKARELLAVAGYPNGQGLGPITLTTTKPYQDLCEFIQHELGDIGLTIEIEVIDAAAFKNMVAQGQIPVFRKSWIMDYPDPENFFAPFYSKNYSPGGYNYTHFSNAEFDRLYEATMTEQDQTKRNALFHRMDRILIEEAPMAPLYYDEIIHLVQNNIEGLDNNPINLLDLRRVRKRSVTRE